MNDSIRLTANKGEDIKFSFRQIGSGNEPESIDSSAQVRLKKDKEIVDGIVTLSDNDTKANVIIGTAELDGGYFLEVFAGTDTYLDGHVFIRESARE